MAVIRPFRGVRYNPAVVGDFHHVVSPPYDVISAEQQTELHLRSPYNAIHLDLNQDADRYAALIGGAAMTWFGLRRRSWAGLGLAAVGAALMYRGASGGWPFFGGEGQCYALGGKVRRMLNKYGAGVNVGTSDLPRTAPEVAPGELDFVHAASEDSFPASDPPAWTGRSITQVAE